MGWDLGLGGSKHDVAAGHRGYLTPDKRKLQAKGIASVGARVMNLRESFPELSHDKLCSALAEEFRQREGEAAEIEDITEQSELTREPGFQVWHALKGVRSL